MKTSDSFFKAMILLAGLLLVISNVSCRPTADPLLDMLDTQLSNVKIDSLTRTMNFVVSPERFEKGQFEEKLAASLNRWGNSEKDLMDPDGWSLDEMAKPLMEQFPELPAVKEMNSLGFVNTDSFFLQQNFWSKKLADRLVANRDFAPFEIYRVASGVTEDEIRDEEVDPLTVAIQKIQSDLGLEEAADLAAAVKIFDWVVRNIYLLPESEINEKEVAELKLKESESVAESGVPGTGYTRFPWQTLLFSRGDYVERAKLFMTILQQRGIDSVWLEVKSGESKLPWAIGVRIGRQLFVFDTKLGLPIPGGELGKIATLEELKSDPDLLNSLDLSVKESLKDETDYWVKPSQLSDIDALLLVSPENMAYRFWELENKLVGDARMRLTTSPTEVISNMPKMDGVEYGIWDISFRTHQFRLTLREAVADASFKDDVRDKISWYFADELYINQFVQYRTARSKYFHGLFDVIRMDGNLNAIEWFYKLIYKDNLIDSLAIDRQFQVTMNLSRGKMSAAEFEDLIRATQANMRLVRRDAGFFLSNCHFDNGNFSTANNWLTRLEQIEDTERWQTAINYLRSRSLEAQRDYASAIEALSNEKSEQFHGNLIRTRLLKAIAERGGYGLEPVNEPEANGQSDLSKDSDVDDGTSNAKSNSDEAKEGGAAKENSDLETENSSEQNDDAQDDENV